VPVQGRAAERGGLATVGSQTPGPVIGGFRAPVTPGGRRRVRSSAAIPGLDARGQSRSCRKARRSTSTRSRGFGLLPRKSIPAGKWLAQAFSITLGRQFRSAGCCFSSIALLAGRHSRARASASLRQRRCLSSHRWRACRRRRAYAPGATRRAGVALPWVVRCASELSGGPDTCFGRPEFARQC
jgi:hypothetical protein